MASIVKWFGTFLNVTFKGFSVRLAMLVLSILTSVFFTFSSDTWFCSRFSSPIVRGCRSASVFSFSSTLPENLIVVFSGVQLVLTVIDLLNGPGRPAGLYVADTKPFAFGITGSFV